MKRNENKYPETESFKYFNANPRNRITGDCAFRAISKALNQDYNKTVMEMAEMMCKTGYALNDKKGIERYLESKGWVKHKQPKNWDNTKLSGKQFCKWLSINYSGENIVCLIGGHHVSAIIPTDSGDGINNRYKIHDIWDCSSKCVGNYWSKRYDE